MITVSSHENLVQVNGILYSGCAVSSKSLFPIIVSVKTFSCLVAFALSSFPLSPSANPIDTSPQPDNVLEKRLDFAVSNARFPYSTLPHLMYCFRCTAPAYSTLQGPKRPGWACNRPAPTTTTVNNGASEGGKCQCHDDGHPDVRPRKPRRPARGAPRVRSPVYLPTARSEHARHHGNGKTPLLRSFFHLARIVEGEWYES